MFDLDKFIQSIERVCAAGDIPESTLGQVLVHERGLMKPRRAAAQARAVPHPDSPAPRADNNNPPANTPSSGTAKPRVKRGVSAAMSSAGGASSLLRNPPRP